ncbi:hypothetical protein KL86DYS1_30007 [uncultured Dysgonomonas sp.]|uniref:Uncharacterized protein n=1 Tax=uncultured Dysgonomonas sp. TaxID=206096 RepID=A0A212JQ28_9BACT|nr:hypothetical protein KL86DYS1_30007 [uncultured Dysgonomonas sp.]
MNQNIHTYISYYRGKGAMDMIKNINSLTNLLSLSLYKEILKKALPSFFI